MDLKLNNSLYDFLNALVRYIMPAAGALYFGLSQIWGFPAAEEVIGTIALLSTFFGGLIALARNKWKPDDVLVVDQNDPDGLRFGFESGRRIEDLEDRKTLTLTVKTVESHEED